jgi:hypothetical protein
MSEVTQLILLIGSSAFLILAALGAVFLNRWVRTNGVGSSRFITASASTNLCKKLKPVLRAGDEIIMPAGFGRYPLALSEKARNAWERQIQEWTREGIQFTLVITTPNAPGERYWQKLVDTLSPNLKVFVLDQTAASPDDSVDIARLHTFHPVLVIRGSDPLGMWLEGAHEENSGVAYNIEYVASPDIIDFQRARFFRLYDMLRRLTDESRRPPHLKRLMPNKFQEAAPSAEHAA